jgi:hypothetical protein
VYNSEKFLAECIESVLNQTYKNIEIIAINDGSTDDSLKILNKYSNKISIVSQENQGLSYALNTGISKMTGKWLKWFSPDDILDSRAIEILVEETKQLPKNTIIYSNWQMINEKGEKLRDFSESNYNKLSNFDFNVRLLDSQQINVNTTLIPIFLIKTGCSIRNLDNQISIDYDFFLRSGILYDTKFHLIEKILVKYRIHSNQLSHKKIISTLSHMEILKESILSNIDPSMYKRYLEELKTYNNKKSFLKKIMRLSLKIATKILPNSFTDKILLFYLNKLRQSR